MNLRRALIASLIVIVAIAAIFVSRQNVVPTTATFGTVPVVSRPYASHRSPITTTWYCPGVPAGDDTVGGQVVISNYTDVELQARITLLGSGGVAPITQPVTVAPRDRLDFDVDAAMTAPYVSAFVEIDGGEGMVEQRAIFPAGDAVASCTTQTSSVWYFADGFTASNSVEQLVITNPTADTANVDLTFVTAATTRSPSAFQGKSIAPYSVEVISIADSGFRDEGVIAVKATTTVGRIVLGRVQQYIGGGRFGYSLNLASPVISDQLWFADGRKGSGVTEQYVLYNPTNQDVSVDVLVLGIGITDGYEEPDPVPVPAGKVVTFDMSSVVGLPDGPHSVVFSTLAQPAIVAERVLTEPTNNGVATSVVMGMTSEYVVTRWYVPIGVDEATTGALVVQNLDGVDATVTVKAIGPGGAIPVPGLEAVPLPASAVISIDLTDPSVFGEPLVVEATQRIFVERRLPRGHDQQGRSGSWAMPECGSCNFSSQQS
ncbi:MAG: DUF5719 family protein [Ilumatobacteraceae bacterium]